jgi:hypothetical protein
MRVFPRNEIVQSLKYLAKRADPSGIGIPRPPWTLAEVSIHIRSSPDGPLQSAHDAFAEVFCNVEGRHLVQVGITDFIRDLLGPPHAVVLPVDHELISVSRTFRQPGFIDALDRNAKFRVVQFLRQNHQEVFALNQGSTARPVGSNPGPQGLVGIIPPTFRTGSPDRYALVSAGRCADRGWLCAVNPVPTQCWRRCAMDTRRHLSPSRNLRHSGHQMCCGTQGEAGAFRHQRGSLCPLTCRTRGIIPRQLDIRAPIYVATISYFEGYHPCGPASNFDPANAFLAGPDIAGARRVDSAATTARKSFADSNACDTDRMQVRGIGMCRLQMCCCHNPGFASFGINALPNTSSSRPLFRVFGLRTRTRECITRLAPISRNEVIRLQVSRRPWKRPSPHRHAHRRSYQPDLELKCPASARRATA